MRPFFKEINCPLHPYRKEKVWFEPFINHQYICNGCENSPGGKICDKCIIDMHRLYGGFREDPINKQIREMFEVAQENEP